MRFLPLLFLLLVFRGHAQYTHVWTGAQDNQWNNMNNWQPATVPTTSSKVKIDTYVNCPVVLASSVEVADFYLLNTALNLQAHTLKSDTLRIYFSELTANNGKISSQEMRVFVGNTVLGDLQFETQNGQFQAGNRFQNAVQITLNACATCAGFVMYAPNVFNGQVRLTNKGQGFTVSAYSGTVTFNKKMTLINAATADVTSQYFGQKDYLNVRGNVVFEDSVVVIDSSSNRNSRVWFTDVRFNAPTLLNTKGSTVYVGMKAAEINSSLQLQSNGGAFELGTTASGQAVFTTSGNLQLAQGDCSGTRLAWNNCKYLNNSILEIDMSSTDTTQLSNEFITSDSAYIAADLTVLSPLIQLDGGMFNGKATFNRTKSFYFPQMCAGGNVFADSLTIMNASGSPWFWGAARNDVFGKAVRAVHSAKNTNELYLAQAGSTTFKANLTLQSTPNANAGGMFVGFGADSVRFDNDAKVVIEDFGTGTAGLFNVRQRGTTVHNRFTLHGNGILRIENSTLAGVLSASSPQLYLNNSVFLQPVVFVKTANGLNSSVGNNTFRSRLQLVNNATAGSLKFVFIDSTLSK